MKIIRTRRITIRKREVLVSRHRGHEIGCQEGKARVCPLCNSLLPSEAPLLVPAIGDEKNLLTAGSENLPAEEN